MGFLILRDEFLPLQVQLLMSIYFLLIEKTLLRHKARDYGEPKPYRIWFLADKRVVECVGAKRLGHAARIGGVACGELRDGGGFGKEVGSDVSTPRGMRSGDIVGLLLV